MPHILALTLAPETRAVLYSVAKILFIIFIVGSFINVAVYSVGRVREGRLFDPAHVPLPIKIQPPFTGWIFVVCVIGFIYMQSVLFPIMVMFGVGMAALQGDQTLEHQFGFDRLRPGRALRYALFVFGAVVLVVTPLNEAWSQTLDYFHLDHPDQLSVQTFRSYTKTAVIVSFMLQAVIFNPIIEELFFRGFLLTFLRNYTSASAAIILSAGVFAFAHLNLGAAIPLWFFGIVLGLAYEHTGSLLVPISVHALFNLATGLSLLVDKGNPT